MPDKLSDSDKFLARLLIKWWQTATDIKDGDRASLARLRRCSNIAEAVNECAFIGLLGCCGRARENDWVKLALVASVLAYIRGDQGECKRKKEEADEKKSDNSDEYQPPESNARLIGPDADRVDAEDASSALYKIVRFRRLLSVKTVEECQRAFRRLVMLMKGKRIINIEDLVASLLQWSADIAGEEISEKRHLKWVEDYYWNTASYKNSQKMDSV
ncbi:type I-E CRISPR-associated protein Cse2/CasB [Acetobacteraceae bacterium ESL0709]|nr:type I-E CRISPR-associated protein Cse2/CasB [Acetobacteraceae bacterium ESL0697]MDF7677512.1 type I-E CRISPR-associated protein Cse2/CasB [Acetobacteraceae bacterium ESL0709]